MKKKSVLIIFIISGSILPKNIYHCRRKSFMGLVNVMLRQSRQDGFSCDDVSKILKENIELFLEIIHSEYYNISR